MSLLIALNCISPAIYAQSAKDSGYIQIDELNFPDENFRDWLTSEENLGGIGSDGTLSALELDTVTEINIPSDPDKKISSLEGIDLNENQLQQIDLSSQQNLVSLQVDMNNLEQIDLSNNTKLEAFFCSVQQTEQDNTAASS